MKNTLILICALAATATAFCDDNDKFEKVKPCLCNITGKNICGFVFGDVYPDKCRVVKLQKPFYFFDRVKLTYDKNCALREVSFDAKVSGEYSAVSVLHEVRELRKALEKYFGFTLEDADREDYVDQPAEERLLDCSTAPKMNSSEETCFACIRVRNVTRGKWGAELDMSHYTIHVYIEDKSKIDSDALAKRAVHRDKSPFRTREKKEVGVDRYPSAPADEARIERPFDPEALKAAVAAKPEYDWNDIDEGTIVGVSACKAAVELQRNDNHMLRLSLRDKEIAQEAAVELSDRIDALEREIRALKAVHTPNGEPKSKVVPPPQTNQSKAKPFDALPFGVDIATLPVRGGAMERYGEIEAVEKSDRLGFGFTTIKVHADRKTGAVFSYSSEKNAEYAEYERICQAITKEYGVAGCEDCEQKGGYGRGEKRFELPHRTVRVRYYQTMMLLQTVVSLAVEDRDMVERMRQETRTLFDKDRLEKFDFNTATAVPDKWNVLRRRKYKEFPPLAKRFRLFGRERKGKDPFGGCVWTWYSDEFPSWMTQADIANEVSKLEAELVRLYGGISERRGFHDRSLCAGGLRFEYGIGEYCLADGASHCRDHENRMILSIQQARKSEAKAMEESQPKPAAPQVRPAPTLSTRSCTSCIVSPY